MKTLFSFGYSLVRWIIISLIFLLLLLLFMIESPATLLALIKSPLQTQGIVYGEIKGSLISGFEINDLNYQNRVKAKKIGLKVDWEKLEHRTVHIKELTLEGIEVEKNYLTKLIENNQSKEESNSSLPLEQLIIDSANISLSNIEYQEYFINSIELEVKNLKSDLKQQYIGDIYLMLDSNIAKLDLNSSINNKNVKISSTIEAKNHFLNTFAKDYNVTFTSNPLFTLKAEGDIEGKVAYQLETHRFGAIQNEHQIESQKLQLLGAYNLSSKESINHIDTLLYGNMAEISLVADTTLNIEDINNTLEYTADLNTTIEQLFLNNLLREQNLTFLSSPLVNLKSKGNFNDLEYHLEATNLNLTQNEYQLERGKLLADGRYSVLDKDISVVLNTKFDSSVATPLSLDLEASLNLNDINNTLNYKADLNTSVQDDFLNPLLEEQNITFLASPNIQLKSEGNFEELSYHLHAQNLNLKQNEYLLNNGNFLAHGDYSLLHKDVSITLDTHLDSNIANPVDVALEATLNLDDINGTLTYKTDVKTTVNEVFLSEILAEQNLSFLASPHVKFKSKGDFEALSYHVDIENVMLKQNKYQLYHGSLLAHGNYSVLHKDATTTIESQLDTNLANPITLTLEAKLNTDDINNTLHYNLKTNIVPQKEFIQSKIPDNILIQKIAPLDIVAKGTLAKTTFKVTFEHLSASREELEGEINSLSLQGHSNILNGETTIDASTLFDSSVGGGKIKDHATLNFNRLEETVKYRADIEIVASSAYLNNLIKDKSLKVQGTPNIQLKLRGDMRQLTLQLNAQADVIKEHQPSKVDIKSSPIVLNLKEHTVEGKIRVSNDSKNLGLNFESSFNGDYTQPKSLEIEGDFQLQSFNAFGINLNNLTPLNVSIINGEGGATFTINSKRIKLIASTSDYDHFRFALNTKNLYLYKMIELPEALDHKFIKLDIKGETTLSTQMFTLHGDVFSNKRFHAKIDAQNNLSGLDATFETQYLLLTAQGDIKSKNIVAKLTTNSLSELQDELFSLYEFEKIDVDGELSILAKIQGEENIHLNISSPQLLLDGFNIERLELDALYYQKLLTLNRFNFNTTGFVDNSLNREFYLNKKGLIYLGERRDVLIDMHPSVLIKMQGDKTFMEGDFKITKLPLGHPSYGSMILSTDVHYQQEGKRKSISGDIILKKMKLFYEAKFLDADRDPDVVIITKKDKTKEKSEDDFLENTYIDLRIHAPEANYKTPDIDLLFDVNVEAHKEFGSELALSGKVEEINGRFDQVPKRFKIVRSNIVFKGDKKINPLLDIHVEYELPQVLININVGGSAERPKIEFSSEPPMPKKDIMSYLLLGVSTASFANGEGSVSREAELFIINQAARDLAYEMEFDRVFVKDDGTGEGFAIEVGKKVSPKNMIIIETSKEGNSLIIEHDISKNLKLRVGHHQKEQPSQSIDIFFRKRFK